MTERALPGALKRKSNRMIFLLALTFGIISAILVAAVLSSSGNSGSGSSAAALVATRDIKAGTTVTADMVKVKSLPSDVLVAGRYSRAEDAIGKVAVADILAGEQMTGTRIVAVTEVGQQFVGGLAGAIPLTKPAANCTAENCGQRAMAVSIAPSTAAGGLIRAGYHVDVVLAFQDGSVSTLLQDIEVLSIGQNVAEVVNAKTEDGNNLRINTEDSSENAKATTATLALWPQEALKLAAGEEFAEGGSVKLLPSTAEQLGIPKDFEFDCKGSIRLLTRNATQKGTTEIIPAGGGGLCAQVFNAGWNK